MEQNGLLIFTSGPEYGEVWGDNGGYDLYHASLSSEEYTQILLECHFKILVHNVRDPECGEATVWVAQKNHLCPGQNGKETYQSIFNAHAQ